MNEDPEMDSHMKPRAISSAGGFVTMGSMVSSLLVRRFALHGCPIYDTTALIVGRISQSFVSLHACFGSLDLLADRVHIVDTLRP